MNPKGYELTEHIATKVDVNARMRSASKKEKYIWIMNTGKFFDSSMVVTMGILVALVNRKIGKASSISGIFADRPYMILFIYIFKILISET